MIFLQFVAYLIVIIRYFVFLYLSASNGYAVLVGSIVGGVAGMACVIFSLCIMCYVRTLCCSKPRSHHGSVKTPPSSEKKVVMCTSLPADVIRSLDAPPPYTGMMFY